MEKMQVDASKVIGFYAGAGRVYFFLTEEGLATMLWLGMEGKRLSVEEVVAALRRRWTIKDGEMVFTERFGDDLDSFGYEKHEYILTFPSEQYITFLSKHHRGLIREERHFRLGGNSDGFKKGTAVARVHRTKRRRHFSRGRYTGNVGSFTRYIQHGTGRTCQSRSDYHQESWTTNRLLFIGHTARTARKNTRKNRLHYEHHARCTAI